MFFCTERDQVSHIYITSKIMVLYIFIFKFLERRWEEDSKEDGSKHSPDLICAKFLHECSFDLLLLFPNILTSLNFQRIY